MPPAPFLPPLRRRKNKQHGAPPSLVPHPLILLLLGIFSQAPVVSAFSAAPKSTAAPIATGCDWRSPSTCERGLVVHPRAAVAAAGVDHGHSRHHRRRGRSATSTGLDSSPNGGYGSSPNGGSSSRRTLPAGEHDRDDEDDDDDETLALFLMGLASAHSIPAALRVCVRLGLPDVLSHGGAFGGGAGGGGDRAPPMSVEEVASAIERRSKEAAGAGGGGGGGRDGGVGQRQRRGAAAAEARGATPSPTWGVRARTGGGGVGGGTGGVTSNRRPTVPADSYSNRRPAPADSYSRSTSLPPSEPPSWGSPFLNSRHGGGGGLNHQTAPARPRPGVAARNQHPRPPAPEPREVEVGGEVNRDALLRIMRLLASVGVLYEKVTTSNVAISSDPTSSSSSSSSSSPPKNTIEVERRFGLTKMGTLLRTETGTGHRVGDSLASCVEHWTERPMWDAWLELPAYVAGVPPNAGRHRSDGAPPFDRANGGTSAGRYYSEDGNPESLRHAAEFRRYSSDREVEAVLGGFDWAGQLSRRTVVHIGGKRGEVMRMVAERFPWVNCLSLDLPEVVGSESGDPQIESGIQLVGGDAFDPSTIPVCDAVFMKHFLDRRKWTDEQAARILRSCHDALGRFGRVILGEAVLPDDAADVNDGGGGRMRLVTDAMLLLVGQGGQRTETDWTNLAGEAGFAVESINPTQSPGCYIIVLAKASPSSQEGVMEAITTTRSG